MTRNYTLESSTSRYRQDPVFRQIVYGFTTVLADIEESHCLDDLIEAAHLAATLVTAGKAGILNKENVGDQHEPIH